MLAAYIRQSDTHWTVCHILASTNQITAIMLLIVYSSLVCLHQEHLLSLLITCTTEVDFLPLTNSTRLPWIPSTTVCCVWVIESCWSVNGWNGQNLERSSLWCDGGCAGRVEKSDAGVDVDTRHWAARISKAAGRSGRLEPADGHCSHSRMDSSLAAVNGSVNQCGLSQDCHSAPLHCDLFRKDLVGPLVYYHPSRLLITSSYFIHCYVVYKCLSSW